jgi:hypothetical protein
MSESESALPDIRKDMFVSNLLRKIPAEHRDSFSDIQLQALKVALGARSWGAHAVDIRGTLRLWRWRYYYVFLAGRNIRSLSRRQETVLRATEITFLLGFLVFSLLLGVLALYLIKSFMGIDLIEGYSFGVWSWFKNDVMWQ